MKNLKVLIDRINPIKIVGSIDKMISAIAYDSRKCIPDSMFIALRGSQVDGHKYINSALELGSSVIVCEEIPKELLYKDTITFIVVNNSRIALAEISHIWYDFPTKNMNIIGITGTNGKTTTTYLIKEILEYAQKRTAIIGTTGIFIDNKIIPATHTTPESLELCEVFNEIAKNNVKYVSMEVSSHALDQHRVYGISYDAALFSNLTLDHLDYHKTIQEYAKAKKKLFEMLKPEGIGLVMDNGEYSEYFYNSITSLNKYYIGRTPRSDIQITKENLNINSTEFELVISKNTPKQLHGNYYFTTNLLGSFNIDNAAMAITIALLYGLPYEIIKQGILQAKGAPGRMQRVMLRNSAIGIVDYSHTPDALEKALKSCRELLNETKEAGRLISVFGCGGNRDNSKRPIMGKISSEFADYSIITSDNPRTEDPNEIIKQIYSGIADDFKKNIVVIPNRSEAIQYAVNISKSNDLILVAGKGHENYQILGNDKIHFDDVEELTK